MSDHFEVVCSVDDRDAWLAARASGIGASEIAAACGESSWQSPYTLWAAKLGLLPEKDDTEAMAWGRILEPVVIGEYARRTQRHAERQGHLLRSRAYPWALATLDGLTSETFAGARWPLEVKTASAFVAEQWDNGPPPAYYLQIQQQMLVTGAKRATSACLLGGQRLVWCDVARDDDAIRRIVARGSAMWRRIQDNEPPPVDGSESTAATLSTLYPDGDGKAVCLPHTFLDVADELEAAKKSKKVLSDRIDHLEAIVKEAIGDNTYGALVDGRVFSWASQTREAFTVKETTFRVLRMKNPSKKKGSKAA